MLDVRFGTAVFGGVGVGTTALRAAVDFSDSGRVNADVTPSTSESTRGYMYPPKAKTSEKNLFTGLTNGAMVFDTDLKKLQVYVDGSWVSLN